MTTQMIRQTLFTTGEIDVVNYKRTDIEGYLSAAQSLENCEIAITGLARKRQGTQFLLDVSTYADIFSQLYSFRDNLGNYYIVMSAPTIFYVFSIDANTLALALYTTVTGTPYQSADLGNLDWALDGDSLVFSSPMYAPARLYIDPASYPTPSFLFQLLGIFPVPAYDFGNINYNNATVTLAASGSTLTMVVSNLPVGATFTSAWIGGQIVGAGNTDLEPIGVAIITAVSQSGTTATFTATMQIAFNTTTYSTSGSQYSISQPAWSDVLGWPSKTLYYQNRLWFANTQSLPDTIFGSGLNAPLNFDVGTATAVNAIIYNIGQNDTGGILWINGGKQLEIYTENYEFVCPQDQSLALTPGSFAVRQQSSYGSSNLMKPVTYLNDSYFVTRSQNAIVNFHFEGIGLAYTGSNVVLQSSHLLTFPQKACVIRGSDNSQDNFIYFRVLDAITAFQFAAEYKLAALTPITLSDPSSILIRDIVTVNNNLFMLKSNLGNTLWTLDVMTSLSSSAGLIKMDGMSTVTLNSDGTVNSGIDYLNGFIANLVFLGNDYGSSIDPVTGLPAPVTGGVAHFYNPLGLSGGAIIGLVFQVNIVPMYVYAGNSESNYFKDISRIYVDYYNSINFTVNGQLVPYQNFTNTQQQLGMQQMTGTAIIDPVLGWDRFQTFIISQLSPFDLNISAIAYQIESHII